MDQIKNVYKNWMREEIENPEVQKAKEAFLQAQFGAIPKEKRSVGSWVLSPSFRLALVGCCALAVLIKTGMFETETIAPVTLTKTVQATKATHVADENSVQIKKLGSEMGPTVAYQKHFSDVQITVLWVFPKGA